MKRSFWMVVASGLCVGGVAMGSDRTSLDGVGPDNRLGASNLRALAAFEADRTLRYDPHTVLVRFEEGVAAVDVDAVAALLDGEVLQRYTLVPGLVHMEVGVGADAAMEILRAWPGVEYAEPDWFVTKSAMPNDPWVSRCWGLHNTGQTVNGDPGTAGADIDAPEAWDIFRGNPNFVVGVIDTGIQRTHPDLQANIWTNTGEIAGNGIDDDGNGYIDDTWGWNFVSNNNNPNDDNNHGTHCAGTIGAVGNNGVGIVGVNWNVKMAGLKFLNSGGSGSISAALSALQYCTRMNIKVSNNSWGGGGYSSSFFTALENSKSVGHLFVAAAGNGGTNNDASPSYPASYTNDNVIAVAATDNDDRLASFSQYGATSVDIGAPGVNVYSTIRNGSYAYFNGTSMATPHVAGVVALVYGQNTAWTYQQVRSRILSTARPIAALNGRCVTGGVVNARMAVVSNNTPPVVNVASPTNNASYAGGSNVLLSATASDTQDGNLTGSIVWTSSLHGVIGTGGTVNIAALMPGTHVITASATDSMLATTSVSRTITMNGGLGTAPVAPYNLRAYRVSGTTVDLRWVDASINELGFQVEREQRINNVWVNTTGIGTVWANQTQMITNTPTNGSWRFRVRAYNGLTFSTWSAWSSMSN
ncbi:MAG: S8 family serine peptidase [Phycisphaeraceae bacterium]|nr:MAG: S8 family serine peptidase [Phycisphaeraceae bacterium]